MPSCDGTPVAQEARSHTPSFFGDSVFNKSLTVVLPVYNGESRLRKSVNEILELASELTSKFGVLIIDDGSNDATYEVAEELAAHYPQVSVMRHRHRRGLGSAIDYVQRQIRSDAVIMHDGVTPIDACQIRSLWRRWAERTPEQADAESDAAAAEGDKPALTSLPAIHAAMERAHGRLMGFQMIQPAGAPPASESYKIPLVNKLRNDMPRSVPRKGLGTIPAMPRPKFLTALANFAFGE